MKLALFAVLAAAGCDGVFGLQHIPERMRDAAPGDVADGRTLCSTFAPAVEYQVGKGPQGLTIADFTGDGTLDIATANAEVGTVTVLKNAGNGTFEGTPISAVADIGVSQVVAAHIDGNNTMDLAATNAGAGKVSLFANQGDSFQSVGDIMTGSSTAPSGLAAGSFAGTSDADLAVTLASSSRVAIFLSSGGTHTASPPIDVQLQPTQVVAAKLDDDDILDLVVANAGSSTISIALGAGNGTFGNAYHLPAGSLPRALAAAPLAPGMSASVFVVSSTTGSIDIFKNEGAGELSQDTMRTVAVGALGIAAGDVNGDTLTDLVVTGSTGGTVSVLEGDGQGTFTPRPPLSTGSSPYGVGIADFDGDGHTDLAVANSGGNTVSVFLGCH
ncbi:MAG: VCBS repeat-containing protein [Kofleriaceae bacterium]|nr:VCBS repeat-containing protein [Kofleriaceae bacterium]